LYAHAKVAICFPKTTTHPDRAGGVETLTYRYWEAMASKCVIVGQCPRELVDLLGYNPVVEADPNQPLDQLLDGILLRIERYQRFADRNYDCLLSTWTVDHQAETIAAALREIEQSH
jgi:hypothetical protein